MLTIGFANHYYTLWSVEITERKDTNGATYIRTTYTYKQNLSMNLDEAEAKVAKITDDYAIDLELRGESGRFYYTERMIKEMDMFRFSFGKLAGHSMLECNDVWQLTRAMKEEGNMRRRVYARRRLIEIGELVRYTWEEKRNEFIERTQEEIKNAGSELDVPVEEFIRDNGTRHYVTVTKKNNWCPVKLRDSLESKKAQEEKSGHFFEDKKRVSVNVKLLKSLSFESTYGTVFIQIMETEDGKVLKYKGSSSISFQSDWMQITGTVEHSEYCGVKETRLKRIKAISGLKEVA